MHTAFPFPTTAPSLLSPSVIKPIPPSTLGSMSHVTDMPSLDSLLGFPEKTEERPEPRREAKQTHSRLQSLFEPEEPLEPKLEQHDTKHEIDPYLGKPNLGQERVSPKKEKYRSRTE